MHSDIIDDILEVEDNAVAIVDNAEKQAREIVYKAQSERKDMMLKAVERQRAENDRLFTEADALLKERLAAYEEERQDIKLGKNRVSDEVLDGSVSRIVDLLLGA